MVKKSGDNKGLHQQGVHVHSTYITEFDEDFLKVPYQTPYAMHKDGFSDEFLDDALSKIQHKLFGPWGLIGEKGGNDSYADRSSVYIFGQLYGRGTLDLKTRGLMVLAGLCVLQRENVIPTWANACRNLGWSEDELKELGALVSHIGGFPQSRASLMIFDDVFEKRRQAEADSA
ncbi:4-carboxymuconolactone decarboxylase [Natronocella acetinitrilica]|uniref:4-carboxymuconolactone decarboxylase n=1 Tax=Natronocella acetinitrilica TaxID=414046 RepID=A0AAE3G901_9GAMM|nr:carboxymuconolactone decarboxylase family protein [Natronocella acetinitrilica]MCP1677243.1 4-carboxymuconolactone decarboxylase [Natronocella acetinitrilica]